MASNHLPFGNYSFQDCVRSQPQHPPLVRMGGIEPPTTELSALCSTTELHALNIVFLTISKNILAPVLGVEPSSQGFGDLRITTFPHRIRIVVRFGL